MPRRQKAAASLGAQASRRRAESSRLMQVMRGAGASTKAIGESSCESWRSANAVRLWVKHGDVVELRMEMGVVEGCNTQAKPQRRDGWGRAAGGGPLLVTCDS